MVPSDFIDLDEYLGVPSRTIRTPIHIAPELTLLGESSLTAAELTLSTYEDALTFLGGGAKGYLFTSWASMGHFFYVRDDEFGDLAQLSELSGYAVDVRDDGTLFVLVDGSWTESPYRAPIIRSAYRVIGGAADQDGFLPAEDFLATRTPLKSCNLSESLISIRGLPGPIPTSPPGWVMLVLLHEVYSNASPGPNERAADQILSGRAKMDHLPENLQDEPFVPVLLDWVNHGKDYRAEGDISLVKGRNLVTELVKEYAKLVESSEQLGVEL